MQLVEGALVRQPGSVELRTAQAVLMEQMGRADEAHQRYERIIADNPGAGRAASRLALMYIDRKESLDVALTFMTNAKRLAPDNPEVSDALGWVYYNRNLLSFAMAHLEDAVRVSPRNAQFQHHLGLAYQRANRADQARQALTRAVALDRTYADRQDVRDALASLPKK
jgi:Flp pilus assembly protein TadD